MFVVITQLPFREMTRVMNVVIGRARGRLINTALPASLICLSHRIAARVVTMGSYLQQNALRLVQRIRTFFPRFPRG